MAADTQRIGSGELTPMIKKQADVGNLEGKQVAKWQTPLFIALVIIGMIGLGAAGAGFASFGAHQSWWSAGGLSNLSQMNTLIMMAAGGGGSLLLVSGIVGLVKASQAKKQVQDDHLIAHAKLSELDQKLSDKSWTFVRQEDGNYSLVMKHPPREGEGKGEVEVIRSDIPYDGLEDAAKGPQKYDYTFIYTSPCRPDDILINMDTLEKTLKPQSYTFVLQLNGQYSLVAQDPQREGEPITTAIMKMSIKPDALAEARKEPEEHAYQFIKTSDLPDSVQ